MILTVVIPTHNPNAERLARTLEGLRTQTLSVDRWETLVIDNASSPAVSPLQLAASGPSNLVVIREAVLGLTAARRTGFLKARGKLVVLVDDDNVLAPNFLADVVRIFEANPQLGAAGGPSVGEFEVKPPAWAEEFLPMLALRDLGEAPVIESLARSPDDQCYEYPASAPIGAGLCIRREAAISWVEASKQNPISDRRGSELTSGGDNDIVLHALHSGWKVGYFPQLSLVHLIPAGRLNADYLARLNRGIRKSWVQVLARHGANPWSRINRWSVPLRKFKAWFAYRAWQRPSGYIRWQGACGHFEGLSLLNS